MANRGRRLLGRQDEGTPWMGIADMMSGLMIIFIFISVANMRSERDLRLEAEDLRAAAVRAQAEAEERSLSRRKMAQKLNERWVTMKDQEKQLIQMLRDAFADEIERGELEIQEKQLAVNFLNEDTLFDGNSSLRKGFKDTLLKFMPKLLKVIHTPIAGESDRIVEELLIEGHTSSPWESRRGEEPLTREQKYFENLKLSQNRARNVLEFTLKKALKDEPEYHKWVELRASATGRSSSQFLGKNGCKPYTHKDERVLSCEEDEKRSKRVLFRLRTTEHARLRDLVDEQLPALIDAVRVGEDIPSTDGDSQDD